MEQDCSGLPFRELGALRDSCSAFGFLYQRFSFKPLQYAHDFALLNGQVEVALPDGRVLYGPKQKKPS